MKYLIILTILLSSCKYEYHIILNKDSTSIYNRKHKLVGILPFDSTQTIDKFFIKDNL